MIIVYILPSTSEHNHETLGHVLIDVGGHLNANNQRHTKIENPIKNNKGCHSYACGGHFARDATTSKDERYTKKENKDDSKNGKMTL